MKIETMQAATWDKSLAINLTSQQRLMQYSIPFLRHGIDPTIIVIGSKNVPAPGPGAAAYSAAKAGVTQLARVAALELAGDGIRVNMIHPDAVFDTGIWTPEILAKRAQSYGLTIQQYKTKNLLHAEITSHDVAKMVCALAGEAFSRTTGAQIPLDGGNDRVI
jgi:NAD(P)-dependent dehydrogenase (short-subunit alcohol dehydrogenase family)